MSWDKVGKDVESGPLGTFMWVTVCLLAVVVLFGGVNLIMKPASMAVDRIVMKTSFQYKEGMEQRAAILQASITELDIKLRSNPTNKQDLDNQRLILSAQLRAITINQ